MAGFASWSDVPPEWQSALSDRHLLDCAGKTVFARGQDYHKQQKVRLRNVDGDHSAWYVDGTETYFVDVAIRHGQLHVLCSCPYGAHDFCKHMVAVCLAWRAQLGGDPQGALPVPPSTSDQAAKAAASEKRRNTLLRQREALKGFVAAQDAGTLAGRLWAWAERDRDLMAELKLWAAQSQAQGDPASVKDAITGMLRARGFLDWRDSTIFARQARKVLPLLKHAQGDDPVTARQLCEHALRKLYQVCGNADDSSGEIGELLSEVMDLLLDCLKAAPPPASWLDTWMSLVKADPWGLWSEDVVMEAAGEAVARRYADKVASDWAHWLKTHPQPKSARKFVQDFGDADWDRHQLRERYLASLQRQGDFQGALEVMRAHLDNAAEHSQLVAYCESLGKMREASQYAQAAFKLYPDDLRCEADLLRCHERDGWDDEALALRRRQLERQPTVSHYRAVLVAAKAAGLDVAQYREQLLAWAESHDRGKRASNGCYVGTRVRWLLADGKTDEALTLVQPPNSCEAALLQEIARGLPAARRADAVPLMMRVFDDAMSTAKSPYDDVLSIVAETAGYMPADQRQSWLEGLCAKYKARRNFVNGLAALVVKA